MTLTLTLTLRAKFDDNTETCRFCSVYKLLTYLHKHRVYLLHERLLRTNETTHSELTRPPTVTVTHLLTSYSINVHHKSHATSVTLKLWIIERLLAWQMSQRVHIHDGQVTSAQQCHSTAHTLIYTHRHTDT